MFCNKCGFENSNNANFCENCGNKLNPAAISKKSKGNHQKNYNRYGNRKKGQTISIKSLWVVALAVIVGFFIYSILDTNSSRNFNANVSANNYTKGNSVVEAKVFEIASNFVCSCGGCDEDSLELCDCNFAKGTKQFIRSMVQDSQDDLSIITAVNNKYGGLKTNASSASTINTPALIVPGDEITNTATYADRTEIYSHFECPCGQCGMDELKDCTCEHPNGAVEVKSFIDSQIVLNQFSVDEIVSQVAQKYGGKKTL